MSFDLLNLVQQHFDLEIVETDVPLVEPRPIALTWQQRRFAQVEQDLAILSEKTNEATRREFIVGQILIALALNSAAENWSLYLGVPFRVNPQQGLTGVCDYLISREPLALHIPPPVALIVEVKRSLHRALPHCLVELVAAQQWNQSDAAIYGAMTTGSEWQFLKLEGQRVTIEQTIYSTAPIEHLINRLAAMIAGSEPHSE